MLIRVALPQSREPEFQTMAGSIEAQNGKGGYSCDGSCHGLAHGSASGISLMPRDESLVYHLPPELTKTACRRSLVKRLFRVSMVVLLMIGGKLSAQRAKAAHFVGHLPVGFKKA